MNHYSPIAALPTSQKRMRLANRPCQCAGDSAGASDQALDQERARREAFVSILAHELRQPLSILLTAVEVVRLAPDGVAAAEATGIIERQARQMTRLVEDLADATRWARGTMTLQIQRLDLGALIQNVALDVTAAAAERGHRLVIATAPEPLWIDADPERLHQVLSNLLDNAVKYTDPFGRITVTAHRGPAEVTVRVSDTGRGIDPGALPHIFDLFSQARPFEHVGLGIGLSVVREIVALHGGHVEARSDGPGQGSEFIVTLPLASALMLVAHHAPASDAQRASPRPSYRGRPQPLAHLRPDMRCSSATNSAAPMIDQTIGNG
jgi:signal transduction histidine kinase